MATVKAEISWNID